MQASQSAILTDFTTTIRQWVAYLDVYSMDKLTRQPGPHSWSMGQVYIHIIGETEYYISQVKAALHGSNSDQQMQEDAKTMLANNSFPDQQLVSPAETNLPQPASKEELRKGLLALQLQAEEIMATTDLSQAHGKAQHPGLGFLTASQWLQLAAMHLRHHFRQKARIDAVLSAGA